MKSLKASRWLGLAGFLLVPLSGKAALNLHYNFEGVDPAADPNVPNVAAGATVNGTLNNPAKVTTLTGTIITVGTARYSLGTSLSFNSGDGDNGEAGHVDTGFLPEDLGMTNGDEWNRDYTAMAWVQFTSTTGDNMIFGQLTGVTDNVLHHGSRNGSLHSAHWGDDIGPDQSVVVNSLPGTWHHLAYTNSGSTQSIYRDGVLVVGPGATGTNITNSVTNILVGTSQNGGSFVGLLDEVKIFGDEVLTPEQIQAEMVAGLPVYTLATLTGAILNTTEFVFTIVDDPSSVIDLSKPRSLIINETDVTASAVFSKTGNTTTITYVPVPFPAHGSQNPYSLSLRDGSNTEITATGSLRAPYFPTVIPGAPGTVGSWSLQEINSDVAIPGSNLQGAIDVVLAPPVGAVVVDQVGPVINHSDPDSRGGRGIFLNELDFLTNVEGVDDNDVIIVGKTKLQIAAPGDYTFGVHSDDGFGLRISGGPVGNTSKFVNSLGAGSIDISDPRTLVFAGATGDSSTRGVFNFTAAGTYDVEFIGFELTGGAFWEVYGAPGAFLRVRDTGSWALIGNPADPSLPPYPARWLQDIPGPLGTAGNWGVRTYLQANTVDNLQQTLDFLRDTTRTPADGDDLTFDGQQPDLNDRDPESTGVSGHVPGDRNFQGNTTASDDRVVTVAKARIAITEAGEYTFNARGDDGFLLRFKGANGLPNPSFVRANAANTNIGGFDPSNPNELFYQDGTGDSDTRGVIALAVGEYDVEYVQWEGTGGFFFELSAAKGSFLSTADTNTWRLVGYKGLPATALPVIGPAGWTVVSTPPDSLAAFTLAAAEEALLATGTNSNWDTVNFTDPQSGGGPASSVAPVPWPNNTPNDDNNYAIKATADLIVSAAATYRLGFQGDDGGYLIINGTGGLADPSFESVLLENATGVGVVEEEVVGSGAFNKVLTDPVGGTGNSRTIAQITLQPGTYKLTGLMYEGAGGSYWGLVGAIEPLPEGAILYPPLAKGGAKTDLDGIQIVAPTSTPFHITAFTFNPLSGAYDLTFLSEAGVNYALEYSTGLQPAGDPTSAPKWNVVPSKSSIAGAAGTTNVVGNISELVSPNGQLPNRQICYFRLRRL